jgi:predicted nuclease of restriction endonuclease-like (RecB) superfamily
MSIQSNNSYNIVLADLKEKIRLAKQQAVSVVNTHLLLAYWEIGKTITDQEKKEGWGAKVIDRLSLDLKMEFPEMTGLSPRNLRYMRDFALTYRYFPFLQQPLVKSPTGENIIWQPSVAKLEDHHNQSATIVQPVVAQLPWAHHIVILSKIKTAEEREFYIKKAIENNWSKSVLTAQINSDLYKRQGQAITNFQDTLSPLQGDRAIETLKNPYLLEFLGISEEVQERELEKALINHLKDFMRELGRGFAYVGNQKNLVVDGDDFFLDMLFFNTELNCYVIFELKVGDFKPEFAGKLNFYVNVVNEQLKRDYHNPSIGVLLCKTPNETVVKYSLTGIASPIGVADYEFVKALPKKLKGQIPSVEELEAEIEKEMEELKSPSEKRLDSLKAKLASAKIEEIKTPATYEILCNLYDNSLIPLYKRLLARLTDFNDLFLSHNYFWQATESVTNVNELSNFWKNEDYLRSHHQFVMYHRLNGFKKGGANSFDIIKHFTYVLDTYSYGFTLNNYNQQLPFFKKLYHQELTKEDIEFICDTIYEVILGEIEARFESMKQFDNSII